MGGGVVFIVQKVGFLVRPDTFDPSLMKSVFISIIIIMCHSTSDLVSRLGMPPPGVREWE